MDIWAPLGNIYRGATLDKFIYKKVDGTVVLLWWWHKRNNNTTDDLLIIVIIIKDFSFVMIPIITDRFIYREYYLILLIYSLSTACFGSMQHLLILAIHLFQHLRFPWYMRNVSALGYRIRITNDSIELYDIKMLSFTFKITVVLQIGEEGRRRWNIFKMNPKLILKIIYFKIYMLNY